MTESHAPKILPVHGGQLGYVAARYGLDPAALIDFSANINPSGPPQSVWNAIQLALAKVATLTAYPDLQLTQLKRAIAQSIGIRPESVPVANGFVPLLDAALRSHPARRCLLPVPSFSEYRRSLEHASVAVIPYRLRPEDNFAYRPEPMLGAMLAEGCDSILLANPQNPSGAVCEADRMLQIITAAADHGITVFLDEAFIDYSPNDSLARHVDAHANLIIFRSLTKFFAVPGLRVAYAVCNPSSAQALHRFIAPWPVTSLASDAVCAALRDRTYLVQTQLRNQRERCWLEKMLAHLNVHTYPSGTNFLLVRFPSAVDVSLLWERMLTEHHIVLRSCENFESLGPGHLRIAVLSDDANKQLIAGLKNILTDPH